MKIICNNGQWWSHLEWVVKGKEHFQYKIIKAWKKTAPYMLMKAKIGIKSELRRPQFYGTYIFSINNLTARCWVYVNENIKSHGDENF